jgi:hypothetical protein
MQASVTPESATHRWECEMTARASPQIVRLSVIEMADRTANRAQLTGQRSESDLLVNFIDKVVFVSLNVNMLSGPNGSNCTIDLARYRISALSSSGLARF